MPIVGLLNTTARVTIPYSWDGAGQPIYTSGQDESVRIEPVRKMVQLTPTQKIMADARAFIGMNLTIQPGYRLAVGSRNYRVLAVARCEDITATPSHQELLLAEER